MANLMIETATYLAAAAAVGFMTAWLVSRARWRRREAELATHELATHTRSWETWEEPEEPEDTRSAPCFVPCQEAREEPPAAEEPLVLVAPTPELADPDFGAPAPKPRRPTRPERGGEAAAIARLALPESGSHDLAGRRDSRRARIAAVLRTPEYSYPLELVVESQHHGRQLRALGLRSTLDLLRKCPGAREIASVAASTGIDADRLRRWASLADLMRMEHVRSAEAKLLLEAGIDSSQALAAEDASRVAARMASASDGAANAVPSMATVASWIVNARALPPRLLD